MKKIALVAAALAAFAFGSTAPAMAQSRYDSKCVGGIMHDGTCFSSEQLAMQYGYQPAVKPHVTPAVSIQVDPRRNFRPNFQPPRRNTMKPRRAMAWEYDQPRRGVRKHEPRQMSPEEEQKLQELIEKKLGPLPADAKDYTIRGIQPGSKPHPSCTLFAQEGKYKRWQCPEGTVAKLRQ